MISNLEEGTPRKARPGGTEEMTREVLRVLEEGSVWHGSLTYGSSRDDHYMLQLGALHRSAEGYSFGGQHKAMGQSQDITLMVAPTGPNGPGWQVTIADSESLFIGVLNIKHRSIEVGGTQRLGLGLGQGDVQGAHRALGGPHD